MILGRNSISEKIMRNTKFNALGYFWGILIILTPYIIHHLGIERVGMWVIIGVLVSYFGILDFN